MASHIELFSKYKELASECNQLKANSLPGNPYVLVLVDLHTHNVGYSSLKIMEYTDAGFSSRITSLPRLTIVAQ